MSTPYIRRPNLEGNTDVSVLSQPYLQGTVRRSADGTVSGFAALVATVPADLVVETEGTTSGPVTVTFTAGHSALLNEIIATLNSALFGVAVASERDGCLRLTTAGVGETATGRAFIRVHAATNDWNGDGFADDCAAILGFATYPNAAATCTAGDIESSATRPLEQGNAPGTRFVARGEDRLSIAFNRGLAQLASNTDVLRTAGYREAAYPVAVPIDSTLSTWSGRFRYDAAGSVTQISLADLDTVDGNLTGRIYVGGLSATSTLHEIAGSFFVTNTKGHELSAYDESAEEVRTIRVGAVTRGENGFGAPSFANEESAPTSALPDTAAATPDGRNALGVNRTKVASAVISKIHNKTSLVCSSLGIGTGFISLGVVPGDVAEIAFSTVTSPYTNDGKYIVEAVVSEQEIVVRPSSDTDVLPLNDSTSGSFGTVTVSSGGEWESDIWVTLTPPLARFPEDGKIVLVFGIERETLNQREDANTLTDDASFKMLQPGLTGFEIEQLWQRQGLSGAYAGMSTDRTSDAGSVLLGRKRPVTIVAPEKSLPSAGTYVRGPFTGNLLGQGILKAEYAAVPPHPDTFTLADIGRVVKLSGGIFVDLEPFLITEFIDGAHVRVAPLGVTPGAELPGVLGIEYEVYDDVVEYPNALLHLIAPDEDRDEVARTDIGILYVREQNNATAPPTMPTRKHGQSLIHLERVSVGYLSGTATDLRPIVIPSMRIDTGTTVATVSISVESFQNIFAIEGGDTRPVEAPYNGGSVFRIFNGPNAGYYLVQRTYSTNEIRLVTLDGANVVLDTTVATTQIGAFYNAHVAVGHTLVGKYGDVAYRTAKLRVFFDSLEQGEASGVGISLDWRGEGTGISAQINDADFVAYDSGAGASGYLVDAELYAPAHGVNLSVTAADSGAEERRSARGITVSVVGNQFLSTPLGWGDIAGPGDFNSWGARISQNGADPAVIITQGISNDAEFPHPTNAAVQVRVAPVGSSADRVYRASGTALDTTGSVYVRSPLTDSPGGGIFSETGVSATGYVTSFHRPFSNTDREGLYAFDNAEGATELGSADRLYPVLSADTAPTADLLPPDASKFAFYHIGIVQVLNDADLSNFLSPNALGAERFIGAVVEVTDSSTVDGRYVVVGAKIDQAGNDTYLAVVKYATTAAWAFEETGTVRLYGRRWHRAYLNIADFSLVGTGDRSAARYELPLLASLTSQINERQVGSYPFDMEDQFTDLGLQSYIPWSPAAEGVSIGFAKEDTSAMPNVYVSSAAYESSSTWEGPSGNKGKAEGPLYTHGWATDAKEPRTPFPNTAVFSGKEDNTGEETLSVGNANQLSIDDYTATFDGGSPSTVSWSSSWGGCLAIDFNGSSDPVKVWQRGRTYTLSAHLAVKFHLRLAGPGYVPASGETDTLVIRLCRADGTTAASHAFTDVVGFAPVPIDYVAELSLDQLVGGTVDVVGNSVSLEVLYPVVEISRKNGLSAYLIEFKTETTTRPFIVSGPQIVAGPQLAHSYRFADPVRGFQTVGPADVKLFGGVDYARNESWPTYGNGSDGWDGSNTTGTQELRGTPGLVRMTSTESYYDWYVATQTAAAPLSGDINAFLSALSAAVTSYPGSSYPSASAGAAVACVDACTAGIATATVSDKLAYLTRAISYAGAAEKAARDYHATLSGDTNSGAAATRGNVSDYYHAVQDAITDSTAFTTTAEWENYLVLAASEPETNWIRPWVDYYRMFTQGVNSACITLYNGAFDPLWYAQEADRIYNDVGSSAENLKTDAFILPGMTGFLLPLTPPHGAVLSSVALSLSFRAFNEDYWGIYFDMPSSLRQLGRDNATGTSYLDVANIAEWGTMQGVRVELWRYNAVDFGVSEGDFAGWSEHEAETGFGERLASWTIDLSEISPPSSTANTVTNAWNDIGFGADNSDIYVGKEHFEKRVWNLTAEAFGVDPQSLRVDRRQYTYMLVVRFYGGMRYTNSGTFFPFVRGNPADMFASGDTAPDSRWEIPQAITRYRPPQTSIGGGGSVIIEEEQKSLREIYGHIDAAYYIQGAPADVRAVTNSPHGNDYSFPPQVKFRGARLGWVTDRAADGGWG